MIDVDSSFHSIVLVCYLVVVGDAADAEWSFPSGCQLGGSFGRGGKYIN